MKETYHNSHCYTSICWTGKLALALPVSPEMTGFRGQNIDNGEVYRG